MIAVTLAACQLLALLVPNARRHAQLLLGVAVLVACASPEVYASNAARTLAPFWGAFLDDRGGSQYPLFPNAAFALLGAGMSPLFLHAASRPRGRSLAIFAALLAIALYAAFQAGFIPYERALFWRTSPALTLFRVALVLITLGLCERAGDSIRQRGTGGLSATLAQHSLIAYVAHLLLLYGTPVTPSLVKRFAGSLSLVQCSVAWLLVMTLTVAITHGFQWLSRQRVGTVRWLQAGLTLLGLVMLTR
jgi:uncharacterized membrane protein